MGEYAWITVVSPSEPAGTEFFTQSPTDHGEALTAIFDDSCGDSILTIEERS